MTMISNTVAASARCLCCGQGVGPGRHGGGPRGRSRAERELDPTPGAENPNMTTVTHLIRAAILILALYLAGC